MKGDSLPQFNTVSMEEFPLKWRFTDPRYDLLPIAHLAQVRPLAEADAHQVWELIRQAAIHEDLPFTKGYFRRVTRALIGDADPSEERRIRKWLYQCQIPFQQRVILSYQSNWAIETTWKMLVKYWSAFYYPGSDDITVIDGSFQWALFFFHKEQIFFGTNLQRHRITK